jgi:hypothetical protein
MKIETKYNIGDVVFFDKYGSIAKGKISDVVISSNRYGLGVIYEVNTAPSWYEMFSFMWRKYSINLTENDLYSSMSDVAEKKISQLQDEIDIKNKEINRIRESVIKQQDNA